MCDRCRAMRGKYEETIETPEGPKKTVRYCFCPEAIRFRTGLNVKFVPRGSRL